jgi:hypothetical protein
LKGNLGGSSMALHSFTLHMFFSRYRFGKELRDGAGKMKSFIFLNRGLTIRDTKIVLTRF